MIGQVAAKKNSQVTLLPLEAGRVSVSIREGGKEETTCSFAEDSWPLVEKGEGVTRVTLLGGCTQAAWDNLLLLERERGVDELIVSEESFTLEDFKEILQDFPRLKSFGNKKAFTRSPLEWEQWQQFLRQKNIGLSCLCVTEEMGLSQQELSSFLSSSMGRGVRELRVFDKRFVSLHLSHHSRLEKLCCPYSEEISVSHCPALHFIYGALAQRVELSHCSAIRELDLHRASWVHLLCCDQLEVLKAYQGEKVFVSECGRLRELNVPEVRCLELEGVGPLSFFEGSKVTDLCVVGERCALPWSKLKELQKVELVGCKEKQLPQALSSHPTLQTLILIRCGVQTVHLPHGKRISLDQCSQLEEVKAECAQWIWASQCERLEKVEGGKPCHKVVEWCPLLSLRKSEKERGSL